GSVPGPPRVRHENLPGKGNRIRPAVTGPREYLDDAAIHAFGRPGTGRRTGSGGVMGQGSNCIRRTAPDPTLHLRCVGRCDRCAQESSIVATAMFPPTTCT